MKIFGCNFLSNFVNPTPDSLLLFINKKTHQKNYNIDVNSWSFVLCTKKNTKLIKTHSFIKVLHQNLIH